MAQKITGCPYTGAEKGPCDRLPIEGSCYCPKHKLITEESHNENVRRGLKSANTAARNKLMRDSLATSPLRADNYSFNDRG